MREQLTLWVLEINRKKAFRFILKERLLSFSILTENEQILIKIENDSLKLLEGGGNLPEKKLKGKKETFFSLMNGERKLRKAILSKDVETTLSFREQLLLESLFYLAQPRDL